MFSGFEWFIEYWNDDAKSVECFSSEDGSWEEAPRDGVVRIWVRRSGVWPHANPGKYYAQGSVGFDHYFYYEKEGVAYFGGFCDGEPRRCSLYVWHPAEWLTCRYGVVHAPPPETVKHGVWVDEPWAEKIGLSRAGERRGVATSNLPPCKREIKGCLG